MIEEAMGWEHGSGQAACQVQMTPDQETVYDRAADLFKEIRDNHRQCIPARNEIEGRIYAERYLGAERDELDCERARDEDRAEQIYAYNTAALRPSVRSGWQPQDGRDFLTEARKANRAEFEADLEAGA